MLKYSKTILDRVSFDPFLFEKELKKSLNFLENETEKEELLKWCSQNFKFLPFRVKSKPD